MAAAAEVQTQQFVYEGFLHDEQLVFAVPELAGDETARQNAAQFIGSVAAGAWRPEIEPSQEALTIEPLESLYDAIQAAARGDETARKMVRINVSTDAIERTIKSGHVMQVDLMVNEAGTIQQYGQSAESIQANSLLYAADSQQMRSRVESETRNAFRIKHYLELGILNEYYFTVFSRAADDLTHDAMQSAGFFTDTMSCAIQLTSAADNRLVTESAFVAGTARPGDARHDQQTIGRLGAELGIALADMTATELLDTPLLIHKTLLPNGVIDLVERYDAAAGNTFFGEAFDEAKLQEDYIGYRQQCRVREETFQPQVDAIVDELLAEAPYITSRVMAAERLHEISEKHMVARAAVDTTIDPRVFGAVAAPHIEMARWHNEMGNHEQARAEVSVAIETAESSSCPTGRTTARDKKESGSETTASDESDDCEFTSKECPLCHKKNVKTTVKKLGKKKIISGDCGCSKLADS